MVTLFFNKLLSATRPGRKQPTGGHRSPPEANAIQSNNRIFLRVGQHGNVTSLDGGRQSINNGMC